MSTSHFWGYFASHENLREIAVRGNFPFAHKEVASTRMAYEFFYRLECFGPMRVMSAQRNGEQGYAFVLGHDNATLESIPDELKLWMEKSYQYPAELWTYDETICRFTAPCDDGSEDVLWRGGDMNEDVLWRGGDMKSNLEEWRKTARPVR
ncbi:hypothetical protein FRC10_001179 [Ceratobasidium sp. 414]|nr:hypothetical protein FRC10_001179 [Ceratobasidium sp. 414]